ncbi:MAG TPA: flagellar hook-length control protein FliK [Bacillota bacterium]|nr:flagellar hook-length control protein FliK [Bacillota bacterium]
MRITASNLVSINPEFIELLRRLEVGDTLKGRVLEALGRNITVKTASGQLFTALLQEGTYISKGAFIELVISNITDGKVFAELKEESHTSELEAKITEFLRQVNLPVNKENVEASRLLIKYKLPLDKEAVMSITGLQKSIDNLCQSSRGRIGLLLSELDIKDTEVDVLNKIVLGWSDNLLDQEAEDVPAESAGDGLKAIISEEVRGERSIPVKSPADRSADETDNNEENSKNLIRNINMNKPFSIETHGETAIYKEFLTEKTAPSFVNERAELLKMLDGLGIKMTDEIKRFVGQLTDTLISIRNTDMEALAYLVSKEMAVTPKNLGMLIKNIESSDGMSQLLDKIRHRLADGDNSELRRIKESIKRIFLEPKQVGDNKRVLEQLKDMAKLGEKLEKYIIKNEIEDPELKDALSNLKDNIDFIRSINNHCNFMQIPVLINGNNSTAKVYVFSEGKRRKQINPDDATIVVVLDLERLGHMESIIKVKNKNVNVTFKVESKNISTIIEKNGILLKKSLGIKGYNLAPIRVINLEQSFSLISLEAMISENRSEKIHFDMRV